MKTKKEKWEGELGRTIILASHSLLNERKILLKTIDRLRGEVSKLKAQLAADREYQLKQTFH